MQWRKLFSENTGIRVVGVCFYSLKYKVEVVWIEQEQQNKERKQKNHGFGP